MEIATDEGPASAGPARVDWRTDRRVRDIMADADGERSDRDEAAGWLRQLLASGPVKANDVYAAADAAGLSKDRAKRAKKKSALWLARLAWTARGTGRCPEHEGDLDDITEESTNSTKGAGHVSLHPSLLRRSVRPIHPATPRRCAPGHERWCP